MSDDLSPAFVATRSVDTELESDVASFQQLRARREEKGFVGGFGEGLALQGEAEAQAGAALGKWLAQLPRNVTVGVVDAATNAIALVDEVNRSGREAQLKQFGDDAEGRKKFEADHPEPHPIAPEILEGLSLLRGAVARPDPSVSDELTQSAAQFFIPFAAASKVLGIGAVSSLGAEALTTAVAFEPHAGRFADLLRLLDTDNTLVNAYIDYMGTSDDEGPLEARFKNALDSVAVSAPIAGVAAIGAKQLKRAMTEAPKQAPAVE